jgi:hypothetical protein
MKFYLVIVIYIFLGLINNNYINNFNIITVAHAQPQPSCSQAYFIKSLCDNDLYCSWNDKTNACSSICVRLDPVDCAKKDKCEYNYYTSKCDYKVQPTQKPSLSPSKSITKKPVTQPVTQKPVTQPVTQKPVTQPNQQPTLVKSCSEITSWQECIDTKGKCVWYSFITSHRCRVPCALGIKDLCEKAPN